MTSKIKIVSISIVIFALLFSTSAVLEVEAMPGNTRIEEAINGDITVTDAGGINIIEGIDKDGFTVQFIDGNDRKTITFIPKPAVVEWRVTDSQARSSLSLCPGVDLPVGEEIACEDITPVGGKIFPIDTTALLLAGAQSFSWMIPVVLSGIGIGLFVVSRKPENS